MKNFEGKVYVNQGNARVPHTVRLQAESSFAAQQMLKAQYGSSNVIMIPYEVSGGSNYNPAPWMERY